MVIELPLLLVHFALDGVLLSGLDLGSGTLALFRLNDLLYNGAVYALEAGVVVSFGLAARGHAAFPRWLPTWSLVAGALQVINIGSVFGILPADLTIIGNLGFVGWFVGSAVGLTRAAGRANLADASVTA
jgi:hypothetical protein